MFFQMIKGAFSRQKGKFLTIALTVGLGVSVATAMLNAMFDVGDKVNQELRAYGANIVVRPRSLAILSDVYSDEKESEEFSGFISENDVLQVKTIFWANNIVDFAPFLPVDTTINGEKFRLVGTWFNKTMKLPTGDEVITGIINLKSWWHIDDGEWISDDSTKEVMLGSDAAKKLKLKTGDYVEIEGEKYLVKGVFSAGGNEDGEIYIPLKTAQEISGNFDKVSYIDLSALTTPANDLARKAAKDPENLSVDEREVWYCTAYISSIVFQIEEALPNVRAKAVLQISESEGSILNKIQLLMLLLTVLALACSALGVSNLVTSYVMEKRVEFGLLKAIGALDMEIIFMVLTQVMIAAALGSLVGYFAGLQLASLIGHIVFSANIEPNILAVPILVFLVIITVVLGSVPAMKVLLSTRPAVTLHG
ncbi:MAG: ABC transporter permease [Helicobacteraceae bacterium]|jgi:putative ABC transport system permease protein|nr:ABC transporter permease [Helicobacteraceae bacterium]